MRWPKVGKPSQLKCKRSAQGLNSRGRNINDLGIEQWTAVANIQWSLLSKEGQGQNKSSRIQFEACEHERKNILPIFEDEITQQGIHILKKGFASSQSLPNCAVLLIHQV